MEKSRPEVYTCVATKVPKEIHDLLADICRLRGLLAGKRVTMGEVIYDLVDMSPLLEEKRRLTLQLIDDIEEDSDEDFGNY